MKRLGRYEVLGEMATGDMTTSYLAGELDGPEPGARRVVRCLAPHLAGRAKVAEAFLQEAKLLARLRHPNVVPVRDLLAADTGPALVVDLVTGWTVATVLDVLARTGQRVDAVAGAWIAAEAAAGLHAAHELEEDASHPIGLARHGGVSPRSIMLQPDGAVTWVDLGIARAAGGHDASDEYRSPEQRRGERLDRRSDVYSLGLVLYELTTGRRAFERGSGRGAEGAASAEAALPPPSALVPDCPAALEHVVVRALAHRREERFATAAELGAALTALEDALRGAGPSGRARTARLLAALPSLPAAVGTLGPSAAPPCVPRGEALGRPSAGSGGGPRASGATPVLAAPSAEATPLDATLLPEPGAAFRLALPAPPEEAKGPSVAAPAALHDTLPPEAPAPIASPRLAYAPLEATLGPEAPPPLGWQAPPQAALGDCPPTEVALASAPIEQSVRGAFGRRRLRLWAASAALLALAAAVGYLLSGAAQEADVLPWRTSPTVGDGGASATPSTGSSRRAHPLDALDAERSPQGLT